MLASLLQDRDMTIGKLRADLHDLSQKCDAAHAQAEVSQPYEQRYRDVQVDVHAWHSSLHEHQARAVDPSRQAAALHTSENVSHRSKLLHCSMASL